VDPKNTCAILPLSPPPLNWSNIDWYLKEICGVPFLLRNVLTLQRAGISSLIIYSNENDPETWKRIFEEYNLNIKLVFETDIVALIEATKESSILVLNSGALHTRQEIEFGMGLAGNKDNQFVQSIERGAITKTLNQLILKGNVSLAKLSSIQKSNVKFLPGHKSSLVSQPKDFLLQHKNLLNNCGLNNDSFMDKTITRFFSRQLTKFFLKTPLSPNMITILSLFIGLTSAAFFFQGTYEKSIIGAGFLLLSAWIDCTDGEVARLKFLESKIGGKLDILCDNLVHFSVFFSIGIGLYHSTGNSIFKYFGLLAVFGSLISFLLLSASIIDEKGKAGMDIPSPKMEKTLTNNLANRDFIYFLFLMAIIGRVDFFICITAIGSNLFASYLTYSKIKSALCSN
jgi:phosphatidylglycerophosphate synthase